MASWLLKESVLRLFIHWRGWTTIGGGLPKNHRDGRVFGAGISAFNLRAGEMRRGARATGRRSLKETYGPSKLCALADDKGLSLCVGSGLAIFLPSKRAELLLATQRRCDVPLDSMGSSFRRRLTAVSYSCASRI